MKISGKSQNQVSDVRSNLKVKRNKQEEWAIIFDSSYRRKVTYIMTYTSEVGQSGYCFLFISLMSKWQELDVYG